jgi:hypothetical protein
MNRTLQSVAGIAAATIVLGCGSTVASSAIARRSNIPVVVDPAAAAQETRDSGYLRVETIQTWHTSAKGRSTMFAGPTRSTRWMDSYCVESRTREAEVEKNPNW